MQFCKRNVASQHSNRTQLVRLRGENIDRAIADHDRRPGDYAVTKQGRELAGLVERGVRVREYRVPRNGSVNCFVAPEDEVAVGRLQASLVGVTRVDVVARGETDAADEEFRDVPFDAASGEVVITTKIARLRTMPSHRHFVRLVAVEDSGERVIGDYTFNHTSHT